MNKLRKLRPDEKATNTTVMSRTMQLAVSGMKASMATQRDEMSLKVSADLQRRGTWFSAPLTAAPRTGVEQYWAARALVAETLLSVRDQHQNELAEIRREEGRKREAS
ncbi:hypothetical protein JVU11DRAFT_6130 [Chiua virens]|nr:hypothetical protein JVU11DRAFT_6130 [Chiua virens]